ncbi:MAG: hypothetical protein JWR24_4838 [Actinoallomurus sp.]|nr:hypothetical protein [Actinoallomurus sp.]
MSVGSAPVTRRPGCLLVALPLLAAIGDILPGETRRSQTVSR